MELIVRPEKSMEIISIELIGQNANRMETILGKIQT